MTVISGGIENETELDILQRRIKNKTQWIFRIIQTNIVALSLVIGILRLSPSNISPNIYIYSSSLGLLFSSFISIFGIGIKSSRIKNDKNFNLNKFYYKKLQILSVVLVSSIALSSFGIVSALFGAIRISELKPLFPSYLAAVISFLFFSIPIIGYIYEFKIYSIFVDIIYFIFYK